MAIPNLPTPSFGRSPGPGGEGDSFGLQGGGSSLERAGFSRGFAATLRLRLPLRKDAEAPGRILSRRDSSSIALPAGQSRLGKTGGGQAKGGIIQAEGGPARLGGRVSPQAGSIFPPGFGNSPLRPGFCPGFCLYGDLGLHLKK